MRVFTKNLWGLLRNLGALDKERAVFNRALGSRVQVPRFSGNGFPAPTRRHVICTCALPFDISLHVCKICPHVAPSPHQKFRPENCSLNTITLLKATIHFRHTKLVLIRPP